MVRKGTRKTQPRYAFECQLDKIATELGFDPIEYRLRILQPANSRTANDLRITTMGLGDCLRAVRQSTAWDAKRESLPKGKGVGVAGSAYISGAGLPIYWNPMPHSGAEIRIDRGGGVTVMCGTAEIGQGSDNMLASVAAETLGVLPEDVQCIWRTSLAPGTGILFEPRHMMAGNAARKPRSCARCVRSGVGELGVRWTPRHRDRRVYDMRDPEKHLLSSRLRPRRGQARDACGRGKLQAAPASAGATGSGSGADGRVPYRRRGRGSVRPRTGTLTATDHEDQTAVAR